MTFRVARVKGGRGSGGRGMQRAGGGGGRGGGGVGWALSIARAVMGLSLTGEQCPDLGF